MFWNRQKNRRNDNIQSILGKYGVPKKVDNIVLYQRAFVHRSYVKRPYLENVEQNINVLVKST